MAQQYLSINRGVPGRKMSDFTTGTASASGDDIEIRFNDAVNVTRKDLIFALKAMIRVVEMRMYRNTPPK